MMAFAIPLAESSECSRLFAITANQSDYVWEMWGELGITWVYRVLRIIGCIISSQIPSK